jgi:hypothetical protein
MGLRLYRTTKRNIASSRNGPSDLAMELRLYRSTESALRVLVTVFQNLRWNYVYIELTKVTVRV